jgi:hypothetical protein
MRPQDAEPLAVGSGGAHRVACGAIVVGQAVATRYVAERVVDVGIAQSRQAVARGFAGRYGCEALLHVASVGFQMNLDESFEQAAPGPGQVAAGFQVVGQAPGLLERPRLERRDELTLVDDAVLQREQSEEQIAVGRGSHGEAPKSGGQSGAGPSLRGRPG